MENEIAVQLALLRQAIWQIGTIFGFLLVLLIGMFGVVILAEHMRRERTETKDDDWWEPKPKPIKDDSTWDRGPKP